MNKFLKNVILALIVLLVLGGLLTLYSIPQQPQEKISLSELVTQINEERVKEITVEGENLLITFIDNTIRKSQKETDIALSESLVSLGADSEKLKGVNVIVKSDQGVGYWVLSLLPIVLPILFIAGFIYLMMRSAQNINQRAISFGQTQAREVERDKKKRTTFDDVAGIKEAKEELQEIIEFLKNPKKFLALGAKIPKGVLLVGPPGTGKTLLARAVAGEANVPFFHISGSEFVEMFVGVGASRVRSLFQKAKKSAPAILFIDELDAVGRHRGAGLGGGHDEREQTLNQILVELDGFEPDTNVIVLAATNRPDVLDPALLRPGRFDRRVVLDLPDLKDRIEILKIHARKVPVAKNVNLKKIAVRTPGFSGADLANLINEAAILAARRNKKRVGIQELVESIDKVILGPERKSRVLSRKEKKIAAYHEAGHALVAHYSKYADPVQKVSIVARGLVAGYTLKLPTEDRYLHSRSEFLDDLTVLLGGYVTEKDVFKELTTGASNDLREATKLARKLVTQYGMSSMGPVTFGEKEELVFLGKELHEAREYSDETARKIDEEVIKLIKQAEKRALNLIGKYKNRLEKIAKQLIKKETVEKEEFERLMEEG